MKELNVDLLGINLEDLGRILFSFQHAQKSLFLVGGCVRDMLLKKAIHDIDMTTDARPEEIKRLLNQAGADALYAIGEKYGTIGALFGSVQIEVTTYRSERYTDGDRHPEVEFGTSLYSDLARRDFTVNAMAYDLMNDRLLDPFNGKLDLDDGLLRAVENAEERFMEDPLRIMRALRFHSQLGFKIEKSTEQALFVNASLLETISWERKRDELCKLIQGAYARQALETMAQVNVMGYILPELADLYDVKQHPYHLKDAFEHTLLVVNQAEKTNLVLRLAALFHDLGKASTRTEVDGKSHFYGHEDVGEERTRKLMRRFCFDNETIRKVCTLVRLHMRINNYRPEQSDSTVRRLVMEAGDVYDELVQLARADRESDLAPAYYKAASNYLEQFVERVKELEMKVAPDQLKSPLDGKELMGITGRKQGPWIGRLKQGLTELVYAGTLAPDDKAQAREYVKDLLRKGW